MGRSWFLPNPPARYPTARRHDHRLEGSHHLASPPSTAPSPRGVPAGVTRRPLHENIGLSKVSQHVLASMCPPLFIHALPHANPGGRVQQASWPYRHPPYTPSPTMHWLRWKLAYRITDHMGLIASRHALRLTGEGIAMTCRLEDAVRGSTSYLHLHLPWAPTTQKDPTAFHDCRLSSSRAVTVYTKFP